MIEESLQEFIDKVRIENKYLAFYEDKEKGLCYPLKVEHLLCRIDYLELTKEELARAQFEQKVDKGEYKMYECKRLAPKYEATKIEADKYVLTDKKVMATHLWNVSNQVGIHTTFESFDEAYKLYEEINSKITPYYN